MGDNVNVSVNNIQNWNIDQITEFDEYFVVPNDDNNESDIGQDIQQLKVRFSETFENINTLVKFFENNNKANQVTDLINLHTKMVKIYYKKKTGKTFKPHITY